MTKKLGDLGECPECGDSIEYFKSESYKRFAKCSNEQCNASYPLPFAGVINKTASICPENKKQILFIEPKKKVGSKLRKPYFWTDKPCFSCKFASKCAPILDLLKEYTQ